MWISQHKEIQKLMFRALALHRSEFEFIYWPSNRELRLMFSWPPQRVPRENCCAFPSQLLPHVLCGAGALRGALCFALASALKGRLNGCHCPGDMAVCMRKVMARPWCVTCFYCCYKQSGFDFWIVNHSVQFSKVKEQNHVLFLIHKIFSSKVVSGIQLTLSPSLSVSHWKKNRRGY